MFNLISSSILIRNAKFEKGDLGPSILGLESLNGLFIKRQQVVSTGWDGWFFDVTRSTFSDLSRKKSFDVKRLQVICQFSRTIHTSQILSARQNKTAANLCQIMIFLTINIPGGSHDCINLASFSS